MTDLTSEQKERYHRNILLPSIGIEGQKKILNAQVLIVGSGGLGSPIALYLAAAGVGHIGIIDADRVDLSNLQRQIIHSTPDLGRLKVESAQEKIERLNPDTKVTTYHTRLTSDNAEKIISSWDFRLCPVILKFTLWLSEVPFVTLVVIISIVSLPSCSSRSFNVSFPLPPRNRNESQLSMMVVISSLYMALSCDFDCKIIDADIFLDLGKDRIALFIL